jgi:hypothetical protein
MGIRKQIVDAASTGSGANANRASAAAEKRMGVVEGAVAGSIEDILMRPEVLGLLPLELGARVKVRDKAAMFEAMLLLQKMKSAPPTPANQMLSVPPDLREAGFQMGRNGGRVPTSSAGEMIVAPPRDILRNPGSEAGFQMGGDIPPQSFDPTGLSVPGPRDISVRQSPRRRSRGVNPLLVAGGAAALAAGKYGYDWATSPGDLTDQAGEEKVPATSDQTQYDRVPQQQDMSRLAADLLDKHFAGQPLQQPARKPARPESQLWASQGERSMEYELRPGTPQANTRDALLDAGVEPNRAEGIARGVVSMTQMERDAVLRNSSPRRQRAADEIQQRRDSRMGSY